MVPQTKEQQISDTPRDSELTKEKPDDFSLVSSCLEGSQRYAEIPGDCLLDFILFNSNNKNEEADIEQSPPSADTPLPPETTEESPRSPTPPATTPEPTHPEPTHPYVIVPVENSKG